MATSKQHFAKLGTKDSDLNRVQDNVRQALDVMADTLSPPTGAILAYAGSAAPDGWLACDGSSLLRTSYPDLFATIGVTYGSADATHFNLPDLRGRVAIGAGHGSGLTSRVLGARGGEETHQLTTAELAAHTHGLSAFTAGSGTGTATNRVSSDAGHGSIAATTDNAGSGTAHNNMQPFAVLSFIIKT